MTPIYEWTGASGSIGSMSSLDLVTTATMPGDVLECTVTVVDAVGSQAQGADTITIENRAPNDPSVSITPAIPIATVDDIICQASTNGDPDGQSVNVLSYVWTSDFGNAYTGSVLPANNVSDGETWTCEVLVSDGSLRPRKLSSRCP